MREYIVLSYLDNSLVFDYRQIKPNEKDRVNTNVLYEDSLFCTLSYFKKNYKQLLSLFKKQTIEWFVVKRIITFKYAVIIMNELGITKLRRLFNSSLSFEDYEKLLDIENLSEIDCYFMPVFMIENYKRSNIKVKTNNTNIISDRFMLSQDALDYDVLYYKKSISIDKEYDGLIDDIKEFLRINYGLKSVEVYVYSKEIISSIIELIKTDESKNVLVLLHQSYDKGGFINANFAWLKKLNEECKQELTCEFRIVYSKNYIKNNLFKQLSFNNLKLIFILAIYVCCVGLLIYKSYQYVEKLSTDKLKTELMNNSLSINENLSSMDVELPENEQVTVEVVKSKYAFDNVMSTLTSLNDETVGYLVVKNTNITYPIVQHSDNSYYLKRDFYKKSTSMGWIFLDYRNSKDKFDANNIIYGHSMKNGTMFGTLKKVLSSSWRKDTNNMIISYDTKYGSYNFKIFSVYKVNYTTDYLKTNFESETEFNDFVNVIKNRSVFKSDENVSYGDIILTLSTCSGSSNQRLVVHAVMMEV